MDDNPTSMIGLCQEGKSSPDALREERGCEFFSAFSASCWPLGGGFYSRIEPDFHLLAQLMRLPIRLSLCLLPVSKRINGGIESLSSRTQSD